MTRVPDGKNTLVSNYGSREDVIQHHVDGGFTCIQPLGGAPSSRTLTVSPFAGEMDICPQDSASWYCMVVSGASFTANVAIGFRGIHALYPFHIEVGWWTDLGMWLKQAFTFTFWVWQDLRQITFFLVNILVSTIKRNMEDWFEVQVEYYGPVGKPQGQWSSNLRLHLSSSSSTSQHTPPPDPLQFTILFRLDVEPGETEVQRKSPDDISI